MPGYVAAAITFFCISTPSALWWIGAALWSGKDEDDDDTSKA